MKPTYTRLARLFVSFLFLYSLELCAQIGPGIAPVNLPSGGFNIDGSLLSNSTNGDWVDGTGSGGFVLANSGTPLNTKSTYHLYDEYNSGTDDIFGGGDKVSDNPNSMTWSVGTANNKTDMNNALIHFTTDANGNVWFVFAADRLSNSGNAYIDFEFLQDGLTKTATGFSTTASNSTGGRTEGDFLLTVYFESGVAKFDIQRWTLVSGVWQYKTYYTSLPANSVYAAGNSTTITVPYSAFGTNSYPQNTFIESAVNLTEVLGAIDPCASLKIKTIFVKSKTSTAPSASIKDFFEPLAVSNLTLGSADAGDDDFVCDGGSYKLQGTAVPSSNYSVVSTTWSVISGNATIINPSQLDSYVTINGGSATLRLTVETHPSSGIGTHCVVYDEVTITTTTPPSCLITGTDGSICPSSVSSFSAPSSTSYLWSISGNGTISGGTTSQTVNVTTGSTCNASFTLTLNTTDANGCTSTCTKTVVVNDTTAPVVTTGSGALDHNIQCSDTAAIASALTEVPTATDNCSTTPTIHLVSDVTTPTTNCANGYSRVRTWNFTDGCGNTSANFVQTITVIDNTVPTWTTAVGSLNTTVECSDTQALANAQNLFPIATDNCDTDLSNIVKVAGTFVASSTCANAGTYTNTWTVTDECGNVSEAFTQVINVIDTTVPTWTTTAGSLNTSVECSDTQALANAQNLFPIATDNCDTDLSNIVKVAGTFVASSTCANAGTYTNTWTVTDECGNVSEAFTQTITIQDTTVPDIATKATDIIVECDGQGNQNAIANWLANNGGAIAFDNCSEVIWTNNFNSIANDCSTAVTVVFTATDACRNSASTSATFSVQDNTPPILPVAPATITVGCASNIPTMISLTARDNCSGNITVEGTNSIELGDCENTYTINRTWTFTDACNNISSTSQIIHVIDTTPPTIAPLPELSTIACPNTPVFTQAIATDECGSNVNLTFKDVKTEGSCAGSYSITRNWTATDMCGNSTTASQTINVEDKVAPVIASLPEPTTINCTNSPVFVFATATDECGSDFNLTFKDVKTEGSCAGSYSITRTWTATDTCGNSSTASQTINVEDKTGPITTTEFNSNVSSNCDAIPVKPELVFVDGCSAINSTIFTETISNQTTDSYIINRKWSVSDSCGNTSEFVQTVNVTITNSLITLTGSVCNDGETTSIDLASLLPIGTPTNGTWTDVSNSGKLAGTIFNAATLAVRDYIFEYVINDTNCPRSIRITVTVTTGCGGIVLPCGTIVVHNAFSPNGDGINEKFVIDNINDTNCYPDNTVEIYNRWGVLVYSTIGYNNTTNAFDGISDGRSTVSQSSGLPAGTYFYILTYTSFDNNNVIQNNKKVGYLFLTK